VKTRLYFRKCITALRILLFNVGEKIYQSDYERSRNRWYSDGCESTKRIDFPELDENSLVYDLGGWKGDWASDIYSKYKSKICIFEVVSDYADFIKDRFQKNSDINVFKFGLGKSDEIISLYLGKEGSSAFKNNNTTSNAQKIEIYDVNNYFINNDIDKISLMKINIEGGEYDLMDRILQKNLQSKIEMFFIQFHDFVDNAELRRQSIRTKLEITHDLIFDYPFVWESWKLKKF
jgi:FkbM family methyltransferase